MDKYEILVKYFGYNEFKGFQSSAIDSILELNDTLVLLATGGGKSLIFQIPALIFDGLSIVVTPLISLMVDQVETLKKRKISAEYLNSNMDQTIVEHIYIKLDRIKILYVSPERLHNSKFIERIRKIKVSMIVLDESHSIEGRYNFRPSYGRIKEFVSIFNNRPVMVALTATATSKTEKDIIEVCGMLKPNIFKSTIDRKNLYYGVLKTKNKINYLEEYISKTNEKGIVYATTRKEVEYLYKHFENKGFEVAYYHGGMDKEVKMINQSKFSKDTKIMFATIAFGLGIDIPNIRYVIVYSMPSSIEDLVQLFGRCSRDNNYGEAILLYDSRDIEVCLHFIYSMNVNKLHLAEVDGRKQKLVKLVGLCNTKRCIHNEILKYFNEDSKGKCNNCSNCLKKE